MLVYKRNEYPVNVELFLHYGSDLIRIGVFTDTMLSVIVSLDVKGHRATSPLLNFVGLDLSSERFQLCEKAPLSGFPLNYILTRNWDLIKVRSTLAANYTLILA